MDGFDLRILVGQPSANVIPQGKAQQRNADDCNPHIQRSAKIGRQHAGSHQFNGHHCGTFEGGKQVNGSFYLGRFGKRRLSLFPCLGNDFCGLCCRQLRGKHFGFLGRKRGFNRV